MVGFDDGAVVVAGERGTGRFVAVSDPSIFINRMLQFRGNVQLADATSSTGSIARTVSARTIVLLRGDVVDVRRSAAVHRRSARRRGRPLGRRPQHAGSASAAEWLLTPAAMKALAARARGRCCSCSRSLALPVRRGPRIDGAWLRFGRPARRDEPHALIVGAEQRRRLAARARVHPARSGAGACSPTRSASPSRSTRSPRAELVAQLAAREGRQRRRRARARVQAAARAAEPRPGRRAVERRVTCRGANSTRCTETSPSCVVLSARRCPTRTRRSLTNASRTDPRQALPRQPARARDHRRGRPRVHRRAGDHRGAAHRAARARPRADRGLPGRREDDARQGVLGDARLPLPPHPVHARSAAVATSPARTSSTCARTRSCCARARSSRNVVLGDEINRAPAKTQSALLEAMQEQQVTIEGETRALAEPFIVLATQNPIEQEGTYPLPEAQVDRFLIKLQMGYPALADEKRMLGTYDRAAAAGARGRRPARGARDAGARAGGVRRRGAARLRARARRVHAQPRARLPRRVAARGARARPRRRRASRCCAAATTCCPTTSATSRRSCSGTAS